MLDVINDRRSRLDQARADLKNIEGEIETLNAEKAEASKSPGVFARWRSDYDLAMVERERHTVLIETLEDEITRADDADALEERRKRYTAKAKANAELSASIPARLAQANAILLELARDVAKSALEDQAINARLPEGFESLISADALARSLPALPRDEIGRERVWLWTRVDNGAVLGDQSIVQDLGGGKGSYSSYDRRPVRCEMMPFDEISFHPIQPGERATPLWQMRLVRPDAPGALFDGVDMLQPRQVLAAIERASEAKVPRDRPIETELRPLHVERPAATERTKQDAR
jgi:hypothetical protein